jgi:hypothetical protein
MLISADGQVVKPSTRLNELNDLQTVSNDVTLTAAKRKMVGKIMGKSWENGGKLWENRG